MARRKIHLVSNAHLDPVWLWEWEEGAGEALATFRLAAEFCENFPGFVFCHNEAVLYRFVEDYDPPLFRKIRRLVRQKRWHVMGGWYLQPDCNMPSGESFVRQILLGKRFFGSRFGVEPRTAVNLDPFGHTRGLVQVLAKSGHRAYLCCRPGRVELPLPRDEFVWVGYDGSEVLVNRASAHYCSNLGQAAPRLRDWIDANPGDGPAIHLWGIGNHGGGPSREDLAALRRLAAKRRDVDIVHSTPDAYFRELERRRKSLPRWTRDLNPWAVGCYTSQARVKRGHRRLENELYSAEKMVTAAFAQGLMDYPEKELKEASEDLAFAEFHDILPGSSIPAGEEGALRTLDHGLEILSRLKARAFFALAAGERRAKGAEIPILAFNPHPVPVRALLECEFEPREPNLAGGFWNARIFHGRKRLRSQVEKEASTLSVEWRKNVVFEADLAPSAISRFDCRLETLAAKPRPEVRPARGLITVKNARLEASINTRTGLLDRYRIAGRDVLGREALALLVVKDDADSWGMKVKGFPGREGAFRPASPREAARISGLGGGALPPVRVVEDGEVRTVVESVFVYGNSAAVLRTKIPKRGTEVEVEVLVHWAEKDRMLKLSLPSLLHRPEFVGQVAFGRDRLPAGGDEAVSQKWLALVSKRDGLALRVINEGVYGSDFKDGELRISLLRSPAYAADTAPGGLRGPRDRYLPRQDQGERTFRFWIDAGSAAGFMGRVDREALARNEAPAVLPYFPPGKGKKAKPGLLVAGPAVLATAFKKAEGGKDLVVRLFEPTGKRRNVTVAVPAAGARKTFEIGPFEIKTFRLNPRTRRWTETDLLERPLRKRRGRK